VFRTSGATRHVAVCPQAVNRAFGDVLVFLLEA
jgi:hypothetical protein